MAFAEIATGVTAVKAALDALKTLKDIAGSPAANEPISTIQSALIEAQRSAIDAQQSHATQINRISALETEITRLKAWDAEKQRYEMQRAEPGVILFGLKAEYRNSAPPHELCANCFERGEKSYLQATARLESRYRVHYCPACKAQFAFRYQPPPPVVKAETDYDPFARI